MKKAIAACLLTLGTLCAALPVYAQPDTAAVTDSVVTEDYVQVAENDNFLLWVNVMDCQIVVRQKSSGHEWLSFPSSIDEKETISKTVANSLKSQITVSFLDTNQNVVTVGSYKESVLNDTYQVEQVENGVLITYDFSGDSMSFRIPVQVTLEQDYVQAKLLYSGIEEYGAARITNIDLWPSFGAGSAQEEGYAFLPDGCGALVDFTHNAYNADSWRQPVYGSDPAVNLMLKSVDPPQAVRMPVFGMKKGNSAFLAVISQGETAASIYATSRASDSPYTTVGSSFIYHQYDMTGLRERTGTMRLLPLTQESPMAVDPTVRYYFLEGGDANYSGMARCYRSYLEAERGLKRLKETTGKAVSMSFYGATTEKKHFLGFSYNKKIAATTFADLQAFLNELKNGGMTSADVFLYGFEKGGYQKKYQKKQTFDSKLGGVKGYRALLEAAPQVNIYTSVELTRDYGSAFSNSQYIRSLNRMSVLRRPVMLSVGDWSFDGVRWRYLRPTTLEQVANNWLKSAVKADNAGVLLERMGNELYSDITTNETPGRSRTVDAIKNILSSASGHVSHVAAGGSNMYLTALTEMVTDVPLTSSGHDIISRDVPFYMMTLHGYVRLVSQPINRVADRRTVMPYLLGTGVQANWQLTAIDPVELSKTSLNFLYNSQANSWTEEILTFNRAFDSVQEGLANVPLYSHEQVGEAELYVYENGARILANFSTASIAYDGVTVDACTAKRLS